MPSRFSFDKALTFPFKAAHAGSFPWVFSLVFSLVGTALFLFLALMAAGDLAEVIRALEALPNSSIDEDNPYETTSALFGTLSPLVPWAIIGTVCGWIMWAIFESASQRRYIRDEGFSIRFGGDEFRMMAVGFMWSLLQMAFYLLPMMLILGGVWDVLRLAGQDAPTSEIEAKVLTSIFGGFGIMLLLLPVYIFFATRLAPCFSLTIKEREYKFFDAWNVSRGRFWPILGAYVIIAIGGGILVAVVEQIAQLPLSFALAPALEDIDSSEEFIRLYSSIGFMLPLGIYMLVRLFMSGLLMHFAAGPAAFAARHDPRGGVDDANRMDVFN